MSTNPNPPPKGLTHMANTGTGAGACKRLSQKQIEMLRSFERDGEASDLYEFNGELGWHNRERCITSLWNRGLLNADGLTDCGRAALARLES